jgi:hypothetical protein
MSPENDQGSTQVPVFAAWLVIAAGDERIHGGNDGYEDEPASFYSWDTTVPNHAAVKVGDAIVMRDRLTLLGASVIEEIEIGEAEKAQYVCPACRKGRGIGKPRAHRSPAYLCQECGAEFDVLVKSVRSVKTYRSRHDAGWSDLTGLIDLDQLRAMCNKPRSQLSIRRIRWPLFQAAVEARGGLLLTPTQHRADHLAGGHAHATVRVRVGQARFRTRLLAAHGDVCAFSGPAPQAALDACHLYSYSEVGKHHAEGGLLLRRDLHRLFDLGLVAVNPNTLTIDVADALSKFATYSSLHGQSLKVQVPKRTAGWLATHWAEHRRRLPTPPRVSGRSPTESLS